jgi:hypothetical protein
MSIYGSFDFLPLKPVGLTIAAPPTSSAAMQRAFGMFFKAAKVLAPAPEVLEESPFFPPRILLIPSCCF